MRVEKTLLDRIILGAMVFVGSAIASVMILGVVLVLCETAMLPGATVK